MTDKIVKPRPSGAQLTAEQYHDPRAWHRAGLPGALDKHYEDGTYRCICCGEALFSSTKFNSDVVAKFLRQAGRRGGWRDRG